MGACGTCAVLMTGCAAYGPGQAAPAPAPSAQSEGSPSGGAPTAGAKLTATRDVPVGGGIILTDAALVITQPKAGTFKAFSAICTHQGCTVNAVEDGTINCPCHGSQFAIADGSVVNGPAQKPLPAEKIKVSGGNITAA
ncbi:MAG: Rieske (2Fe-2S) protein [Pseudonocardia sp.]|nr:Rieske (2Fe-2S) protein [Pseudonocardia sp.]